MTWAKFASMGTREIAEAVCRMPSEFYERRNISILDLLKESRYLQDPDAVTEEELERVFRSFPGLIDGWVRICDEPNRYHWILQPPAATSDNSDWVVIYPNDHRPAHIHAVGRGFEAVFNLTCPAGPNRATGELWILPA